jgi:hypothetical protein
MTLAACYAAGAQSSRELRLEGGAARIQPFARDDRDVLVLGALWREGRERLALLASGTMSYARDSVAAVQGIAALAFRPAVDGPYQIEGGVAGAAFGVSTIGRGGSVNAFARHRLNLATGGFWAGTALGETRRDGLSSTSTSVDLGAWVKMLDAELSFSMARLRSSDFPLFEASGIFLSRPAAAHDISDAMAAFHWSVGPVVIDAAHTWRTGLRASWVQQTAFTWSASWEVTDRAAVQFGMGRQLADPLRGTPDARMASASLRLAILPTHETVVALRTTAHTRLVPQDVGAVLIVRVTGPDSTSRIELAGTFSGWEPVALRRSGDGWEAQVALTPGRHRVGFRVDGGPWRSPANLARVKDEFGGESGLIVVP